MQPIPRSELADIPGVVRRGRLYYLDGKQVIPAEELTDFLISYYDNPATGMRGRDALYQRISADYAGISRRQVAAFLANQETSQVHKEVRLQPITRPAVLTKEGQWAVDLTWLKRNDPAESDLKDSQILFTCIDQFSKYAWARILPNKTAAAVAKAMQSVLDESRARGTQLPTVVRSDNGSEFIAKAFGQVLASVGATQRFSEAYNPRQNAMIERFNKTIKAMLYRYMTQYNASKVDDATLQKLVTNYNSTQHGTTHQTPVDIHVADDKDAKRAAQQNMRARAEKLVAQNETTYPDLEPGDHVRVARRTEPSWRKTRQLKQYSAMKQFGFELYTVVSATKGGPTKSRTYTVKDEDGRVLMSAINKDVDVPKAFIRQDLQKVDPAAVIRDMARDEYVVDKVLGKKVERGRTKYLVSWVGHSDQTWQEPTDSFKGAIAKYEARK